MKKYIAILSTCLLLLGLSGCGSSGAEQESSASAIDAESAATEDVGVKTLSEGDLEMDYLVFGEGKKNFVILPGMSIHSVMGSAENIMQAYESLWDDYTIYVFDRVKNMPAAYSVRDMAADTAKAMQSLGVGEAYVFGASQGGMIAQYMAADYPELVQKLVLASTLMQPDDNFQAVLNDWISLAEAKDEDGLVASFIDDVYSEATLASYRDTLLAANSGITDEEYERFLIQARACQSFDSSEVISSISCPALVIGSEGDQVISAPAQTELAQALGAELYLYSGSDYGHGVYDEAPDFLKRCLSFLAAEN